MIAYALFTPGTRWLALLAVGASTVLPLDGFGVDLCSLHRMTGLPCPGCGLTRGFIALTHADFVTAAGANPFALVLFPLFVGLAALAVGPEGMTRALLGWVRRRERAVASAYRVGLAAFLGFGGLRFGWFLLHGETFP
jgi:hypothetical protein